MVKYLISLFMALLIIGCNKEENCPAEIRIPYWVSPIKSEYKLGDTIEIRSKFSSKIRDKNGNLFDFGSNEWTYNFALLPFEKFMGKYNNTSIYLNIINQDQLQLKHFLSEQDDSYFGSYNQFDDSLEFGIKGILIKTGIVRLSSGVGSGPPVEASRSCRSGWMYDPPFQILMNGGINYNLELMDEVDTSANNYIKNNPDKFNKEGGYLLKVTP